MVFARTWMCFSYLVFEAANVPAWMWYSVLSQLISRALHPDLKRPECKVGI